MNNLRLTVFKYITGRNLRVLTLKEQITNLIGKKIVLNLVEVSSEWRGSSGGIEKTTQCQGGMTQLYSLNLGRVEWGIALKYLCWELSGLQVPPL